MLGRIGFSVVSLSCLACSLAPDAVRTASGEFPCPEDRLSVTELDDDRYRVQGCGSSRIYQCFGDTCWREGRLAWTARQRATREFDCAPDSIKVRWIQQETYRVEACGQAVTYACDYDDGCVPEGAARRVERTTIVPIPIVVQ